MTIDWTTVICSAITASIITSFQFLTTRYLGGILDRMERRVDTNKKD
jgi:hypothetical protein